MKMTVGDRHPERDDLPEDEEAPETPTDEPPPVPIEDPPPDDAPVPPMTVASPIERPALLQSTFP